MRLWDIYHSNIPDFLLEAEQTTAVQRLRDVGMNCGCEYTGFPLFEKLEHYSRYDHSMGVALILWHFTGNTEQAMSGLLHDIATPVFAHVVDFLRGDHLKQESTEDGTEALIVSDKALCAVLAKHGLTIDSVSDYHRYPVADNDSPRLCADRLEYTLGNAVNYGILAREQVKALYTDLTVGRNEFGEPELMFQSRDEAHSFAQAALACSGIYVSDADRYAMESLALLLKEAITRGILTEADLHLQEQPVIQKLKASALSSRWEQFCGYRQIIRRDTPGNEGLWLQVFAKKRCIDPYIKGIGRISQISPAFSQQLRAFRESRQDHWLMAK